VDWGGSIFLFKSQKGDFIMIVKINHVLYFCVGENMYSVETPYTDIPINIRAAFLKALKTIIF
jgi:hypothetical protein